MLGKRICIRFDTAVYFSLPRNFSESVFTRRLSALQWIFTQAPPPLPPHPNPLEVFYEKKSDVCRCRSTWSLEINVSRGAGAARRYPEDCLSFIAHISLRCQAGRR